MVFPSRTVKLMYDDIAARWHDAADELGLPRASVAGIAARQDMPGVTPEQLAECFRLMVAKLGIRIV